MIYEKVKKSVKGVNACASHLKTMASDPTYADTNRIALLSEIYIAEQWLKKLRKEVKEPGLRLT